MDNLPDDSVDVEAPLCDLAKMSKMLPNFRSGPKIRVNFIRKTIHSGH